MNRMRAGPYRRFARRYHRPTAPNRPPDNGRSLEKGGLLLPHPDFVAKSPTPSYEVIERACEASALAN
ncbi:MAG: hypothetical protein GY845_11415 [Planctomycetes bacterium]|nr:hypothetical protein [Planctomycetota bacterium]